MKSIIIAFSLLWSIVSFAATPHKYKLVWQDTFKGATFDKKSWTKIPRGTADWNRHMSYADSLYAVGNGKLILRGVVNKTEKQDTARYITGGLYTKDKRTIRYGKVEVKAKLGRLAGNMDASKQQWMA